MLTQTNNVKLMSIIKQLHECKRSLEQEEQIEKDFEDYLSRELKNGTKIENISEYKKRA